MMISDRKSCNNGDMGLGVIKCKYTPVEVQHNHGTASGSQEQKHERWSTFVPCQGSSRANFTVSPLDERSGLADSQSRPIQLGSTSVAGWVAVAATCVA